MRERKHVCEQSRYQCASGSTEMRQIRRKQMGQNHPLRNQNGLAIYHIEMTIFSITQFQGRRQGGNCPPPPPYDIFFFFFFWAMIIPLPHYENFWSRKKKNVSESPPPPPAEQLFQGWRTFFWLARNFAPPPKQTPWRRPCSVFRVINGDDYNDTNKQFVMIISVKIVMIMNDDQYGKVLI